MRVVSGEAISRKGRLLLVAALLVLLFAGTVALVPVTLVANGQGSGSTAAVEGWDRIGDAVPTTLEVIQAGQGVSQVSPPTLVWPEHMGAPTSNVGFTFDEASGAYYATGPARMTFEGVFGDVRVSTVGVPTAPVIAIRKSSGIVRAATLKRRKSNVQAGAFLPSPTATYYRTSPLILAARQGVNGPLVGVNSQVSVGGNSVSVPGGTSVGLADLVWPAAAVAALGWAAFLAALLVVMFGWIVGRCLDRADDASLPREVVRLATGLGLTFVAINSLTYWLPVRAGTVIVGLCALALVGLRVARARPTNLVRSARILGKASSAATVPVVILFFPVLFWGLSYAGQYKTDLIQYGLLGSLSRDHALLALKELPDAQASGILTSDAGTIWRSIDSLSASSLGSAFGLGSIPALALMGITLCFLFVLSLLGLARSANRGRGALILALVLSLSPAFAGLFAEDYISQYYLVAWVPALVVALTIVFRPRVAGVMRDQRFERLAISVLIATMICVYPYFLIVIMAALTVAVFTNRVRIRAAIRMAPIVAVETIVLVNLAWLTVIHYPETQGWLPFLNGLARNILLAPFDGAQKVFLALGFVPFQWRPAQVLGQDLATSPGRAVSNVAQAALSVGWLHYLGFAIMVIMLVVGVRWRTSLRGFAFPAAVMLLVVFTLFGLLLVSQDSAYAAFKAFWTAAALVPIAYAAAAWRRRVIPIVIAIAFIPAMLWARTILADRADWIMVRNGTQARMNHASESGQVAGLSELFTGVSTFQVVTGAEPIAGTDRDVVAGALTAIAANDARAHCVPALGADAKPSVLGISCEVDSSSHPSCQPGIQLVVAIGRTGREELCGLPKSYSNGVIEGFRRA